ncbi:MAG: type II toxin-antitoxin system RelE/ParE family toxin [Chroococcidiopsidaceae cyanobacterium CP_BM_ER_R8_30]|nr:type II toxin-antitoxin system RelE/ParE family toxin [Chroococcidiopsidaceae cyanobacterium CP_BM_ER_R8_30]
MSDESDSQRERYAIRIAKTAEKDLFNLQTKQFAQVAKKIFSLQGNPQPQDCKQLEGYPGGYRIDQGEYRILYTIDDELLTVDIFRIGKRNDGEVYRNL